MNSIPRSFFQVLPVGPPAGGSPYFRINRGGGQSSAAQSKVVTAARSSSTARAMIRRRRRMCSFYAVEWRGEEAAAGEDGSGEPGSPWKLRPLKSGGPRERLLASDASMHASPVYREPRGGVKGVAAGSSLPGRCAR